MNNDHVWAELCKTPFGNLYWKTSAHHESMPLGRYYVSPSALLTEDQLDAAAILAQTLDDPDMGYDMAESIRHVLTAIGCHPVHPYNSGLIPKQE